MLSLNAQLTAQGLSFGRLVPALDLAFAAPLDVPARHVHDISVGGAHGTSLIMPAWNSDGYYGVKIINIFPQNGAAGLPGLHATYTLFDARTGVPLAQLDGDILTAYRTAAAAALGARYLSRADSKTLVVLGTGRIAQLLPEAMRSVRPIERVLVWNHRPESAQRFVDTLNNAGWQAEVAPDLRDAVQVADIVSCATLSETPLVKGEWLRPGTHLDLIGSFKPVMIESDAACFERARGQVFVDTYEALKKSGDLLQAIEAGALASDGIAGDLHALISGQSAGRRDDAAITIFKAVGNAIEDLTAAQAVYEASASKSRIPS
ncbi:ornithine cyclodeaminase family protein [Alcaligenaceae bacterium B3P038]|nr:ornithine cyclodeaminase family protein [Alcaligenaceae bacterium B3P038]